MKAKIFTGAQRTGKTRVANMISEYIGKDKTAFICARRLNGHLSNLPLLFSEIPSNTELLIIDDCPEDFDYSFFFPVEDNRPSGGDLKFTIMKKERGKYPQPIQIPQIIFTTEKLKSCWVESGASFLGRFDIVEFPLSAVS
ncbi:MAG: hypothetical protein HQ522_17685 [Bacteroidetes bacterium]|nr:hypothetical protein [Bacteroidota bacterium]